MPFVTKDSSGAVIGVHQKMVAGGTIVPPHDPALLAFLKKSAEIDDRSTALSESDREMARVIEDLIELMIDKRMISLGELPAAAQEKVLKRQRLRGDLKWMGGLVSEEKMV